MSGGGARWAGIALRFRIPWAVSLALFAYWAFAFLQKYYRTNPAAIADLPARFLPSAAHSEFAWANALELLGRAVWGHLAIFVFVAAVLGIGIGCAGMFLPPRGGSGGRILQALGLGMALGLLLWLGLGLTGLYFKSLAWVLAAAGWVPALKRARELGMEAAGSSGRWLFLGLSAQIALILFFAGALSLAVWLGPRPAAVFAVWAWGLAVLGGWGFRTARKLAGPGSGILLFLLGAELCAAMLLVTATCSTPERFYDAQVYHLACPALFAMHHKMIGLPNLVHSSFPLGMQMLYQWQWLLGGEPAARAWRPWLLGFMLWALWRMGEREGRSGAGLAAAAVFAACPVLLTNACQTAVDLEVCLMVFLACLAVREAVRNERAGNSLVLGAVYGGAALAMKYTAVFWVPWLALFAAGSGSRKSFAGKSAIMAAVLLCWLCPWFLRNWAVVGNPVYPYATSIFTQGRQWEPARHAKFLEQQATYVIESPGGLAKLPWLLSKGNNSENYIGPVFLLFAPLLLLYFFPGPGLNIYAGVAALSILTWVGVTHIHRFLLATWGLLALVIAWTVMDLSERRRWFGRAAMLLLVLAGLFNITAVIEIWRHFFDAPNLLSGRESAAGYLGRKMINSYYGAASGAGSRLPEKARVMMAGETRGLYWPRPFINHTVYDMQAFEEAIRDSWDGKEAAKRLRQRGATHIFFNDIETSRLKNRFGYELLAFSGREKIVIGDLWDGYMEESAAGSKRWHIYRILPAGRAETPAARPLSLDEEALRREFEGFTVITWEGGGVIQAEKKVKGRISP